MSKWIRGLFKSSGKNAEQTNAPTHISSTRPSSSSFDDSIDPSSSFSVSGDSSSTSTAQLQSSVPGIIARGNSGQNSQSASNLTSSSISSPSPLPSSSLPLSVNVASPSAAPSSSSSAVVNSSGSASTLTKLDPKILELKINRVKQLLQTYLDAGTQQALFDFMSLIISLGTVSGFELSKIGSSLQKLISREVSSLERILREAKPLASKPNSSTSILSLMSRSSNNLMQNGSTGAHSLRLLCTILQFQGKQPHAAPAAAAISAHLPSLLVQLFLLVARSKEVSTSSKSLSTTASSPSPASSQQQRSVFKFEPSSSATNLLLLTGNQSPIASTVSPRRTSVSATSTDLPPSLARAATVANIGVASPPPALLAIFQDPAANSAAALEERAGSLLCALCQRHMSAVEELISSDSLAPLFLAVADPSLGEESRSALVKLILTLLRTPLLSSKRTVKHLVGKQVMETLMQFIKQLSVSTSAAAANPSEFSLNQLSGMEEDTGVLPPPPSLAFPSSTSQRNASSRSLPFLPPSLLHNARSNAFQALCVVRVLLALLRETLKSGAGEELFEWFEKQQCMKTMLDFVQTNEFLRRDEMAATGFLDRVAQFCYIGTTPLPQVEQDMLPFDLPPPSTQLLFLSSAVNGAVSAPNLEAAINFSPQLSVAAAGAAPLSQSSPTASSKRRTASGVLSFSSVDLSASPESSNANSPIATSSTSIASGSVANSVAFPIVAFTATNPRAPILKSKACFELLNNLFNEASESPAIRLGVLRAFRGVFSNGTNYLLLKQMNTLSILLEGMHKLAPSLQQSLLQSLLALIYSIDIVPFKELCALSSVLHDSRVGLSAQAQADMSPAVNCSIDFEAHLSILRVLHRVVQFDGGRYRHIMRESGVLDMLITSLIRLQSEVAPLKDYQPDISIGTVSPIEVSERKVQAQSHPILRGAGVRRGAQTRWTESELKEYDAEKRNQALQLLPATLMLLREVLVPSVSVVSSPSSASASTSPPSFALTPSGSGSGGQSLLANLQVFLASPAPPAILACLACPQTFSAATNVIDALLDIQYSPLGSLLFPSNFLSSAFANTGKLSDADEKHAHDAKNALRKESVFALAPPTMFASGANSNAQPQPATETTTTAEASSWKFPTASAAAAAASMMYGGKTASVVNGWHNPEIAASTFAQTNDCYFLIGALKQLYGQGINLNVFRRYRNQRRGSIITNAVPSPASAIAPSTLAYTHFEFSEAHVRGCISILRSLSTLLCRQRGRAQNAFFRIGGVHIVMELLEAFRPMDLLNHLMQEVSDVAAKKPVEEQGKRLGWMLLQECLLVLGASIRAHSPNRAAFERCGGFQRLERLLRRAKWVSTKTVEAVTPLPSPDSNSAPTASQKRPSVNRAIFGVKKETSSSSATTPLSAVPILTFPVSQEQKQLNAFEADYNSYELISMWLWWIAIEYTPEQVSQLSTFPSPAIVTPPTDEDEVHPYPESPCLFEFTASNEVSCVDAKMVSFPPIDFQLILHPSTLSFVARLLPHSSFAFQQQFFLHLLHSVVTSTLNAKRMANFQMYSSAVDETMLHTTESGLVEVLVNSYRKVLSAASLDPNQPLPATSTTPASQSAATYVNSALNEQETIRELLLQLVKCLLPYSTNADGLHQLFKLLEGIDSGKLRSKASAAAIGSNSGQSVIGSTAPAAPPIPLHTSHPLVNAYSPPSYCNWPFAVCGMLIDVACSAPSIPYILFDGDSPSSLAVANLSSTVWPPGLTQVASPASGSTGSTANSLGNLIAQQSNSPSVGYSYSLWLYMEPVMDAASLDCSDTDQASTAARKSSSPFSNFSSPPPADGVASVRKASAKFTLLSLASDDGKGSLLEVIYEADTGTLSLRTTLPSGTPFAPAVPPFEFQGVGLIPHRWCHIMLTHSRGTVGNASSVKEKEAFLHPTLNLYVDGDLVISARVPYVSRAAHPYQSFKAWLGTGLPSDQSNTGDSSNIVSGLRWRWRVASSLLLDEVLSDEVVHQLFTAGPRVSGAVASNVALDAAPAAVPVTPSPGFQSKLPLLDVVSGCYALPSACAEAMDDIAANVIRQRKMQCSNFSAVGTGIIAQLSNDHRFRHSMASPTSPHEHLLAAASSSEQELLTQTDITPLEHDSVALNSIVPQERILWMFHARFGELLHKSDSEQQEENEIANLNLSQNPQASRSHTSISNTGCSNLALCSDATLYGNRCSVIRPTPPQDSLRSIGGIKRLLIFIEKCTTNVHPSTIYSATHNPCTALRQSMLLLLMTLRRNPKNFRAMHALNGYRLLGHFLRSVSGKKIRVKTPSATSPPISELISPERSRRGSSLVQSIPVLDTNVIDLVFALCGLSERGMGGYIANLLALEYLLLDYRLWERAGLDIQIYVFQALINSCVGNPDRNANITALREARFVPWLLVILTNTKTFEMKADDQPMHMPQPHGHQPKASQPSTLLNHILTLLRMLLMSELIEQELHLLANFAMTRVVAFNTSNATKTASSAPVSSPTYSPSDPSSPPFSSPTSASPSRPYNPSLTAARLIQKNFIEMLLDVLMKVSSSPGMGASAIEPSQNRAMAIFVKCISFHWIFGILKGDNPALKIMKDPIPSSDDDKPASEEPFEAPDPDCAVLTLKILLVMLSSPSLLQDFRSSAMQAQQSPSDAHRRTASQPESSPANAEVEQESLTRIISFASLSNLLLPYATCTRLYPILLCMMMGRNIHDLSSMPSDLTMDTLEVLFAALVGNSAGQSVPLVVPEVVDILVDLLNRCLQLLSDRQQSALSNDPVAFFSAAAFAVASKPPAPPAAPKVYQNVFETGVFGDKQPVISKKSKYGFDESTWNFEHEDNIVAVSHTPIVKQVLREVIAGDEAESLDYEERFLSSDLPQSLHEPTVQTAPRPMFLTTETPSAANQTPFSMIDSAAASSFTFTNKSTRARELESVQPANASAPSTPNVSMLNALVLFFMKLLHVSEDFGRVVSRSTFLRPFVSAIFTSAQLNPLLIASHIHSVSTTPLHLLPLRSASALSHRPSRATTHLPPHLPTHSLGRSVSNTLLSNFQSPTLSSPDPPHGSAASVGASPFTPESIFAAGHHSVSPPSASSAPPLRLFSPSHQGVMLENFSTSPTIEKTSLLDLNLTSPIIGSQSSPGASLVAASKEFLQSPTVVAYEHGYFCAPSSPTMKAIKPSSSPMDSPLSNVDRSRETTNQLFQFSVGAVESPVASMMQPLQQEAMMAAEFSTRSLLLERDHSSSGSTSGSFTFVSKPQAEQDNENTSGTFSAASTPSVASSPSQPPVPPPSTDHASFRFPIFRHSISQLLLRFLRQIMLYHLQHKKDGWMIIEKVLDSFPSKIAATSAQSPTTHSQDELIRGYQSAVLSILLIRLQEKLSLASVGPSTSLEMVRSLFLVPLTSANQQLNHSILAASPTKFFTNFARTAEIIFWKIQNGSFVSAHWNLRNQPHGTKSSLTSVTSLKASSNGSAIGLLKLLMNTLTHEGLVQSTDEFLASSAALVLKSAQSRKSSSFSSAAMSGTNSAAAYLPSVAALATLNSSPVSKCLRSLQDLAMNCVLHLYDAGSSMHLSVATTNIAFHNEAASFGIDELVQLNRYIWQHRRILLGEYLLGCHISPYISSTNSLLGANTTLTTPSSGSTSSSFVFTNRSYIACLLFHMFVVQLNVKSKGDLEDDRSESPRIPLAADVEMKPLKPSLTVSSAPSPEIILELKHSALAILIHLVRSKPNIVADLLRATVNPQQEKQQQAAAQSKAVEIPSNTGIPDEFLAQLAGGGLSKRRSLGTHSSFSENSMVNGDANATVTYNLFDKGFDVLLAGFNSFTHRAKSSSASTSTASSSSSAETPISPSQRSRSAEAEGFFDWLEIQHPLIELVFSRTAQPEWRVWEQFNEAFLQTTRAAAAARTLKLAQRDEEDVVIDSEEQQLLHSTLTFILADAAHIDTNRYVRRMQACVERECEIKRLWMEELKPEINRLYAMYSRSRKMHPNLPAKRQWRIPTPTQNHPSLLDENSTLRRPTDESSSHSDSSSNSDKDSTNDLLLDPRLFAWQQTWRLDSTECVSRFRPRLVRERLCRPSALKFDYPYKREEEDLKEARKSQEAFQSRRERARRAELDEKKNEETVAAGALGSPDPIRAESPVRVGAKKSIPPSPDGLVKKAAKESSHTDDAHSTVMTRGSISLVRIPSDEGTVTLASPVTEQKDLTVAVTDGASGPSSTAPTPVSESVPIVTVEALSPNSMAIAAASSTMLPPPTQATFLSPVKSHSNDALNETMNRSSSNKHDRSKSQNLSLERAETEKHPSRSSQIIARLQATMKDDSDSDSESNAKTVSSGKPSHLLSRMGSLNPSESLSISGSGSGKFVAPDSSDRPAPLRRASSFAVTPHGHSHPSVNLASNPPTSTNASVTAPPSVNPNSDRKRKPSFFASGSSRNLLTSPRISITREPSSSPRMGSMDGPTSPHPMALSARHRGSVSNDQQDSIQSPMAADSVTLPSKSNLLSLPHTASIESTDTPAYSGPATPLSDISENATPLAPSTNGGQPGQVNADDAEPDANTYYSSLLTEDFNVVLFEERLRLLLDDESINFHYNCLRIQGLEEISSIFLLCTQSIFIVDQYQVNADGNIIRLEKQIEQSTTSAAFGEKAKPPQSLRPQKTSRRWSYRDIISVHKRRYLLRPAALELFFADQSNYLIVVNVQQRDAIYKNLLSLCPNLTDGLAGNVAGGNATATLTSAIASDQNLLLSMGNTNARDAARFGSTSSVGSTSSSNDSLSLLPSSTNPSNPAVGLEVGVGGLTNSSQATSTPVVSSATNRLTSNLTSIFFANHTLATEGTINALSNEIAACLASFTTEWQNGFISNYDYLILLNSFSGRSFNDLTQFPIVPWVLSDYDSLELDLHNVNSFRDLSKPMGALDDKRAAMHRNKFQETEMIWKEEEKSQFTSGGNNGDGSDETRSFGNNGFMDPSISRAYHYGTHYSSAAVVMYYLLRVEPFTQHLIAFQSGRFDRADRLFNSIKQTYLTASKLASGAQQRIGKDAGTS